MAPNFRTTWLGLVLLALGAWVVAGSAWDGTPASAEPSLRTPRIAAQFVALHDDEEDDHDHDDGDDDEEHDEDFDEMVEEIEIERAHLELQEADLRTTFFGLELIEKLVEIAADRDKTAALTVFSVSDSMEPNARITFLNEVVQGSSSETVRRAARMQLAEAYDETDQPEKAYEQAKLLVLGE